MPCRLSPLSPVRPHKTADRKVGEQRKDCKVDVQTASVQRGRGQAYRRTPLPNLQTRSQCEDREESPCHLKPQDARKSRKGSPDRLPQHPRPRLDDPGIRNLSRARRRANGGRPGGRWLVRRRRGSGLGGPHHAHQRFGSVPGADSKRAAKANPVHAASVSTEAHAT